MPRTTAPPAPTPLPAPPPLVHPDGCGLVAEIEAYLASLPAPAPYAHPYAHPSVHPYGSTPQPWHTGHPLPRATLLDRVLRRPARPVPVSAAGHLRLASRYIGAHGWLQGAMWDEAGRVCLLGAQAAVLAYGYGTPATVRTARVQLMEVLHATGRPAHSPDEFNDRPTTREGDVHQLLDRAAARAARLGL
ncbi:hypothetical protein BX285_2348 [Streptomyces sp. 1114.5]|uniref:DUF6197 family protein n=1 Tax=unclassified Streptomyces TaxID=2593676 RepID=UPI000BCFA854|nr:MULTISPECIES: hypothetical protein [unclassified Streptomyces]RKT17941.1 hypothetical protein BX285_2348 [Streptomyces sp. 1114.5]SOB84148.1 hypothetical protein SAMN06272789_4387 [Streptomyces sp. 1331.2]